MMLKLKHIYKRLSFDKLLHLFCADSMYQEKDKKPDWGTDQLKKAESTEEAAGEEADEEEEEEEEE